MSDKERLLLVASPLMHRTPAFERAAALAHVKGASLHIVAFDYVEGLATATMVDQQALQEMREGYLSRHRQWLEDQAEHMRTYGAKTNVDVTITAEVLWVQRPLEEILNYVQEMNPSLVIKDLEHESLLTRALFTTLDLHLLRDCPAPLHLVTKLQHGVPRKILVAVDAFRTDEQIEALNDEIIQIARKLALQCDAELHLLYAYDLSHIYSGPDGGGFSTVIGLDSYEAQGKAFSRLADDFGVPAESRHFIMGAPAKVIEAFAKAHDIDVIVMGTVSRRGSRRLLGSTTEQVAYHMPSSLLAVRGSSV
ncbi:universal stress protein [Pseudomonas sp. DWP3-1-2]|uniref:universal stress protein n=1 Tax=Pseudomonas sp. DWP3-1-2 TaxID=2804645 RepID=UPI003CECF488